MLCGLYHRKFSVGFEEGEALTVCMALYYVYPYDPRKLLGVCMHKWEDRGMVEGSFPETR